MKANNVCCECGATSVTVDNYVHHCAPCWIDKFINKGGKIVERKKRSTARARGGIQVSQTTGRLLDGGVDKERRVTVRR